MQLNQGAIQMFALYFYSLRLFIKCWKYCCGGLGPANSQTPTQLLAQFPLSQDREKKWTKARGLMYLGNNHCLGKAKAVVISQAKYGISSLRRISRHMSSQFLASRASAHVMLAWEDELHHHNYLSFVLLALSISSCEWHHMVWNFFWSLWVCCVGLLCFPLSASLLSLNLLTFGCVWEEWKPWFCANVVQQ